jgi:hypothetical protein
MVVIENKEAMCLWDIVHQLKYNDPEVCKELDSYLANKLEEQNDVREISYYIISNSGYVPLLPITQAKINFILSEYLKSEDIEWWNIRDLNEWMYNDIKLLIVSRWINGNEKDFPLWWLKDLLLECLCTDDLGVKILQKLTSDYRKRKSHYIIEIIGSIFEKIDNRYIEQACECISKSTPAVQTCLLSRNDVSEVYVLKGLKALSKLSEQREIKAKINFAALKELSPVARLNTMQQLLGMFDHYYKRFSYYKHSTSSYYSSEYYLTQYKDSYERYGKQKELPFKEIPNREDIEQFLFPCSLKFNKEVSELMSRYDELIILINKKENNNGKCI